MPQQHDKGVDGGSGSVGGGGATAQRLEIPDYPNAMLSPLPPMASFFSPVLRTVLATPAVPTGDFDSAPRPPKPDYHDPRSWAARPAMYGGVVGRAPPGGAGGGIDGGDNRTPTAELVPPSLQGQRAPEAARYADCFFVHPTTYFGGNFNENVKSCPGHHGNWDEMAAELTDCWVIATQATVFNGSCRVWAPEYVGWRAVVAGYRQAAITAVRSQGARDLAYSDVKRAFLYFLRHIGPDTPIVLASHSQGGWHLARLLDDFFEQDAALRARLVCCYLVGSRLPVAYFGGKWTHLREGTRADQTGCVVGWDTVTDPGIPRRLVPRHPLEPVQRNVLRSLIPKYPSLSTNPISWTPSSDSAPAGGAGAWKGSINVAIRKKLPVPTQDQAGAAAATAASAGKGDHHEPTWDDIFSPVAVGMDVVGLVDTELEGITARNTERGLEVPHISRKYLGPMGPLQWLARGWLHCEDYSLFFYNIRDNVALRCAAHRRERLGRAAQGCQGAPAGEAGSGCAAAAPERTQARL